MRHLELTEPAGIAFPGRRQVTALFCDIVGSVSLLSGLGPEHMTELLGAYYAMCDRCIRSFGGYVTDYLGDGVIAYFGYPTADEDDPVNAVRAAVGLRSAAAGIMLPDGGSLQVRMGVATGLVVIEGLKRGEDTSRATLVGSAPNMAARLVALAPPGGIAVEPVTRRIGQNHFRFNDRGGLVLKGFAEKVEVSEVVEALPDIGRFAAGHRGPVSTLVGRDWELRALLTCWSRACDGQGRAVLIHGEAGIGKSRLVKALQDHVAGSGHRSVAWHCASRRSDSALHPIIEQLTSTAGIMPQDAITLRRQKLDAILTGYGVNDADSRAVIADLVGIATEEPLPPLRLTPERRREATFNTLLTIMDWMAGAPAVFIVEDLHWADQTTLDLLSRAMEFGASRPWLLVFTARPDFRPEWPASAAVVPMTLERLGAGDAERICRALDIEARLPAAVLHDLLGRCNGNPLFLEEVTKSVLEAMDKACANPGRHLDIPETLQASLVARLDRLGPLRRVVSVAAVIGPRFDCDLLASILGQSSRDLRPVLAGLARSGLVSAADTAPESIFCFNHALIRDAAYDSLLKRERERLHGQIARALQEGSAGKRGIAPESLAFHLSESGATSEAIPFWSEAARRAASRAAHNEAAAHLSSALRQIAAIPPDGTQSRIKLGLLLALAASLAALHGYSAPEVENAVAEARMLSSTLGDVTEQHGVISACYSLSIVAGDLGAAEDLALTWGKMAVRSQKIRHLVASGSMTGFVMFAKGEFCSARDHLEHAMQSYYAIAPFRLPQNAIQDPLVVCLAVLPVLYYAMGDDAAAERAADELISHARSLGRDYDLAYSLCWRALFEITRGSPAQALPFTQEALDLSIASDFRLWKAVAGIQLVFASSESDPPVTVSNALDLMTELDRIGLNLMRSYYLWQIARLQFATHDFEGALRTVNQAIYFAESFGEHVLLSLLYHCRATIRLKHGPGYPAEAMADLRKAVDIASGQGALGFLRRLGGGALVSSSNIGGVPYGTEA